MQLIQKIVLVLSFTFSLSVVHAQNETETLVQTLQTANFSNLLSFWSPVSEVNILDQTSQKQLSPAQANQQLQVFFNNKNIIGFEKNAERKVGNTIYITGKLLSAQGKFNVSLLLQDNKKGISIVSIRVS
ncbi:MAG: DUF4783 domain-containing protein [Bacteroidetes bacterium]|nr:DUF4783 domain-containing protein [Bacteroidota bacterium]